MSLIDREGWLRFFSSAIQSHLIGGGKEPRLCGI